MSHSPDIVSTSDDVVIEVNILFSKMLRVFEKKRFLRE